MSSVLLVLVLSIFVLVVAANDLFMFSALDAEGNTVSLSKYRNAKAIIIVNVASNCGYTYTNYNQLIELYEKYHKRGLEILAFPSNQFGDQEPGTNTEIQAFCKNYGVTFPVFAKIDVNGPTTHPIYKFLKTNSDNQELPWNFVKYVVVGGYPVKRYHPRIGPKNMEADLLAYLGPEELYVYGRQDRKGEEGGSIKVNNAITIKYALREKGDCSLPLGIEVLRNRSKDMRPHKAASDRRSLD